MRTIFGFLLWHSVQARVSLGMNKKVPRKNKIEGINFMLAYYCGMPRLSMTLIIWLNLFDSTEYSDTMRSSFLILSERSEESRLLKYLGNDP